MTAQQLRGHALIPTAKPLTPCARPRHASHARLQRWRAASKQNLDGAACPGDADSGASSSGRPATQPASRAEPEVGTGLKAVWYGAEVFGRLLSLAKGPQQQQERFSASNGSGLPSSQPGRRGLSREEMLAAIRADYDAQYFVRGSGEMAAYAPDCVFADPFVSFSGTERFKRNVANLGGLMSDIRIDVYEWVEGPSILETRWRFSALLDLPWRPRLAAAGGTTHVMDLERGCVVRHEERWDVEPSKVVAQLLLPASKVPTSAWETFMLSASVGDGKGMWFVLSPLVLRASAAAVLLSLAAGLLRGGEGLLPGPALAGCELAFCGCVATEVVKFAQGMQGAETGTGGRF